MNRRSFLTTTLGATTAAAVDSRMAVARLPKTDPTDLDVICHRWFLGEYALWQVSEVVQRLFNQSWGDLPTIEDLDFRKLLIAMPTLTWCRVVTPRITFDIYETNTKLNNFDKSKLSPLMVPAACLPVNYYLRNGPAPQRLAFAIRQTVHDLCRHAREWYDANEHTRDHAIFVQPQIYMKQEDYLLDVFCSYHIFGSTDATRADIMTQLGQFDIDRKYGQ
jgi:hypothetical protein